MQDENDKVNRVYLNIDGDFIGLIKPKEMRIRLSKINNGNLKFLKKNVNQFFKYHDLVH